jgi:hypothetical protein
MRVPFLLFEKHTDASSGEVSREKVEQSHPDPTQSINANQEEASLLLTSYSRPLSHEEREKFLEKKRWKICDPIQDQPLNQTEQIDL